MYKQKELRIAQVPFISEAKAKYRLLVCKSMPPIPYTCLESAWFLRVNNKIRTYANSRRKGGGNTVEGRDFTHIYTTYDLYTGGLFLDFAD